MTKFSKEIKYIDIAKITDKSNSEVLNKIIKVKIGKPIPYQMFDNPSSFLAWTQSVFSCVNIGKQ